LKEGDLLKDPEVDGKIIEWMCEKWDVRIDWIDLAEDRDKWRALVNVVINLRVS
jgi:hypothetical protein